MSYMATFLGLGLGAGLLLAVVLLAVLVFEIYMFVHVLTNQRITTDRKVLWAIGMLLIHPFVAIIYYFTDYRKT